MLERSGLPRADRSKTLGTYLPAAHEGAADALAAAQEYVEIWLEQPKPRRGLYIWGGVGVGKTHLGIGAMLAVADRYGVDVLYASVARLMRLLSDFSGHDQRSSPSDYIELASTIGLMMLDDLSSIRMTPYRREVIYEILDARWADNKPTIITSNTPVASLEPIIGEPSVSRIRAMCIEVHVEGEDQRRVVGKGGMMPEQELTIANVYSRMRDVLDELPPPSPESVEKVAGGSQWIEGFCGLQRYERGMAELGFAVTLSYSQPFPITNPPLRAKSPDRMSFEDLLDARTYWSWHNFVLLLAGEDWEMLESSRREIARLTEGDGLNG